MNTDYQEMERKGNLAPMAAATSAAAMEELGSLASFPPLAAHPHMASKETTLRHAEKMLKNCRPGKNVGVSEKMSQNLQEEMCRGENTSFQLC
eukprot:c2494_g2_i1 orf=50-328(+)